MTLGLVPGGIPLWFTNIALNLPAFLVAWFVMGRVFVRRTAIAALLLSVWLAVLPSVDLAKGDYLLAALYGGLISGIGIAMVFRTGNATGAQIWLHRCCIGNFVIIPLRRSCLYWMEQSLLPDIIWWVPDLRCMRFSLWRLQQKYPIRY